MKKNKNTNSTYSLLQQLFMKNNLPLDVMDKKIINFLKNFEYFNPFVYRDYISNLFDYQEVDIDAIFAKKLLFL